jgi:hypothetical protein
MTNMKPQGGACIEAPSLRGLQGRSATGLNGQAAKEEVSALRQVGWMPENISGVPAGRSVFHLTSPFIGLLASEPFLVCHALGLETGTGSADCIQLYHGDANLPKESLEVVQRTHRYPWGD